MIRALRKDIFNAMSLFSSGCVFGLEWSLHRHGEYSEEDKNGDRRRRIKLCNGNCHKNDIKRIIL